MSATEQEMKACMRAMLDATAVKEKAEKDAAASKLAAERAVLKAEAEAANAVLKAEVARRKAEVKEQIARAVSEGRIPGTVKDSSVSCRIYRGGWRCEDRPGPTIVRSKLIPKYMPGAEGYFDQYGQIMDSIGDQIRVGLSFDPGICFVEGSA